MTLPDLILRLRHRVQELATATSVPEIDRAAFLVVGATQDVAAVKRDMIQTKTALGLAKEGKEL